MRWGNGRRVFGNLGAGIVCAKDDLRGIGDLDGILDWGTIDHERSCLGDTRNMVNLKWVRAIEAWNNRRIRSHEMVKHEARLLNEKESCH